MANLRYHSYPDWSERILGCILTRSRVLQKTMKARTIRNVSAYHADL